MKKSILVACAAAALLMSSCGEKKTPETAFRHYVESNPIEGAAPGDVVFVSAVQVGSVTVADSLDLLKGRAVASYHEQLAALKTEMEERLEACRRDENSNIYRHNEAAHKYNKLKAQHGNDLKYRDQIEGYRKAAERIPANHEAYVKFDTARDFSYTRNYEKAKKNYDDKQALGVDGYLSATEWNGKAYQDRPQDEVLGSVMEVTYSIAGQTVTRTLLLTENPYGFAEYTMK